MHATKIFHRWFSGRFAFLHAQRRSALERVVCALLKGGKLWLSSLGRWRTEGTCAKHAIKAVDRLLGNRVVHQQRKLLYGAIAERFVPDEGPIVLVDVTELRPGVCALTASLAADTRSVPLYAMVRRKVTISKRRTQRAFLRALKETSSFSDHPGLNEYAAPRARKSRARLVRRPAARHRSGRTP